jgi:predicted transcriptional regulator
MLKNVMQPQEIEVFYIIPAIRSYLAKALKESGKSQKEIAKLFGLRESTVSQYINSKRATLKLSKDVQERIKKLAAKIKTQMDVVNAVQESLACIKKSQSLCEIHKQLASAIPDTCCICFKKVKK